MGKPKDDKPLVVRCPNCKRVGEPDFNEITRRYVCAICASPVDAQVLIEKKKRGKVLTSETVPTISPTLAEIAANSSEENPAIN